MSLLEMKYLHKTWRLLDYSSTDPRINLAVNEAIFRSRYEGLSKDTLHLWQCGKSVIFGGPGSYREDINQEECRRNGAEIVRAISVSSGVLYQDSGSLNFAVATNAAFFAKDGNPVLSAYQILNEGIAAGLKEYGAEVSADPDGIYVNNRRVSKALPKWSYDFLLFQGTLCIDTDLKVCNEVIVTRFRSAEKEPLTSLSLELNKKIPVEDVREAILHGLGEKLGIRFEKQGLTKDEQKLVDKLFRVKYGSDVWNVNGHEPFLVEMGKTAVEVFVAYPPTSACRKLIQIVNEAASDLQDEVKVVIWMRSKGIYQHGPYPQMSSALIGTQKQSVIPAVIINGELKFKDIPSKDDPRKAVLEALAR